MLQQELTGGDQSEGEADHEDDDDEVDDDDYLATDEDDLDENEVILMHIRM